jgi:hypothetical protein
LWSCHTGDSPQGDLATFGYIPSLRCVHTWIQPEVTEMSSIGFVRFSATQLGQKVANSAALWLLRPLPHPPHPIPQHTHTPTRHLLLPLWPSKIPVQVPLGLRIEQLGQLKLPKGSERERALIARKTAQARTGPHTLVPN